MSSSARCRQPLRDRWFADSSAEGAGFEPSVARSRRFEPASVPSRGGRCRRGGYGPGGDRRPDRAVEIADPSVRPRTCAPRQGQEVRFAVDSPLKRTGLEPSVPLRRRAINKRSITQLAPIWRSVGRDHTAEMAFRYSAKARAKAKNGRAWDTD